MKKKLFLFMFVSSLCVGAFAQSNKLDAYTRAYLDTRTNVLQSDVKSRNNAFPKTVNVGGMETVLTIVTLNEQNVLPELQEMGGKIEAQIGDMLIVRVPVDNIVKMSEADEIKAIQVERPYRLMNNTSRVVTNQGRVNETYDQNGNLLTGKGVIVGVIDDGIDFNHVNFKDSNGNSRIKYAMVKGSVYTTSEEIDTLTTDSDTGSHGTHTSGSAAGSYTANGLQGMAPEADLALCGLGDNDSDAAILLGCKNIVDYASSVGKPVAINISLGGNNGPHDGSDAFCKGINDLVKEGVVVTVSSGNEGEDKIYLNKSFTSNDNTIKTLLSHTDYDGDRYTNNTFEVYSYKSKLPSIQFYVVDTDEDKIVYTSEEFNPYEVDTSIWDLSSSSTYSDFRKYYTSYNSRKPDITVYATIDSVRNNYYVSYRGRALKSDRYYIGVALTGEAGTEIHCWSCDDVDFEKNDTLNFVAGNSSKSFNSMVCTENVLGIGAYTASEKYTDINGKVYYTDRKVGDVSPSSSYGVDMNGMSHPDICAPGVDVLSSVNSYDTTSVVTVSQVVSGGRTYIWSAKSGTSMASPIACGIIATWMQYKPTLSAQEVREILQATAVKDSCVTADTEGKWGAGKIDAYAGLQQIIASGVNDVEVSQNNVLVYPNPNGGQFKVVAQGETDGATLNVYNMVGGLVYTSEINASDDAVDVDLSGMLDAGVYVVSVTGKKVNYSTRMIIK